MLEEVKVELIADEEAAGKRLDAWLAGQLDHMTRSKIQSLIKSGKVLLNGEVTIAKIKLNDGDVLTVNQPPRAPQKLEPKELDIDILYEDDDVVVVNKKAGIVVHPGAGDTGITLVEGLLHHVGYLAMNESESGWLRPGIVHRLDKDTSGVMVCAKSEIALTKLTQQFQNKTNRREYLALINGVLKEPLLVRESYLHRDPKHRTQFCSMETNEYDARYYEMARKPSALRWAKSAFKTDKVYGHRLSLVAVRLFTGRTHQIRVHCKDMRTAIIGDQVYGKPVVLPSEFGPEVISKVQKVGRQLLHARYLGFQHPSTGEEMEFHAPIPDDFKEILDILEPYASITS